MCVCGGGGGVGGGMLLFVVVFSVSFCFVFANLVFYFVASFHQRTPLTDFFPNEKSLRLLNYLLIPFVHTPQVFDTIKSSSAFSHPPSPPPPPPPSLSLSLSFSLPGCLSLFPHFAFFASVYPLNCSFCVF